VFGAAIDRGGDGARRARFGNLILSRLPVLQIFTHPLPQPAVPGVKHMPRQATEIVAETAAGPLRVVTTHFEYHSEVQRIAQAELSQGLQAEAEANAAMPGHRSRNRASMPWCRARPRHFIAATSMPRRATRCTP
jgi:endonuclease/exonuclease/phosphatase family metal-dependent hydrolase